MVNHEERAMIEAEIMEQLRAKQREYKREWRKQNPDKVKAANERYWRKRVMREMEDVPNGKSE